MYMDLSSWDIENRRSFEQTGMTMSSTPSSSHSKSLPPLHQVAHPLLIVSAGLMLISMTGTRQYLNFIQPIHIMRDDLQVSLEN